MFKTHGVSSFLICSEIAPQFLGEFLKQKCALRILLWGVCLLGTCYACTMGRVTKEKRAIFTKALIIVDII